MASLPTFSEAFPHLRPFAQIEIISELLNAVFTWRNELCAEIADAHTSRAPMQLTSDAAMVYDLALNEMYCNAAYRDAACSHAAVGALAPFFEGFLVAAMKYLGQLHGSRAPLNENERWSARNEDFWDPHRLIKRGKCRTDFKAGLVQLTEAAELGAYLTGDRLCIVGRVFEFRNRALHHGYEWPSEEIRKLKSAPKDDRIGAWLHSTKADEESGLIYMRDDFLTGCLDLAKTLVVEFKPLAAERGGIVDYFTPLG